MWFRRFGSRPDDRPGKCSIRRIQADFDGIAKLHEGDFSVVDRDTCRQDLAGRASIRSRPDRLLCLGPSDQKGTFLFVHQPKLEGLKLAEMKPISIKARDGLNLPCYLTLPVGVEPRKLAAGADGPRRTLGAGSLGIQPFAQWFANRGYACLMVNFRALHRLRQGIPERRQRQWGKTMHDDLIDACKWAVARRHR